jgi:hypothetical protein
MKIFYPAPIRKLFYLFPQSCGAKYKEKHHCLQYPPLPLRGEGSVRGETEKTIGNKYMTGALDLNLLRQAATDFRYLLARGYPRGAALTLVGNRYHLDHTARQLLHRGGFAPEIAAARRAKLRRLADLPGMPLALDGHNVLITLECALKGLPLVAADDGFIRDVGQVSRGFKVSPAT